MNRSIRHLAILLIFTVPSGAAFAATPPDLIHYQGVLRDASDAPLDGDHDMVFRFWSADAGGDEILVDTHDNAHANPVTVTGGMFGVELGGGVLVDGSGPGTYASLAEVFRSHSTVWLEIEVGGETLSPRVRVISAAYSLNAGHLNGRQSSEFLDTSATSQSKSGEITADASAILSSIGVRGLGQSAGGYFEDTLGGGHAFVGKGDTGIAGYGVKAGGYFQDTNATGLAYTAIGNRGFEGYGSEMGGYFENTIGATNTRVALENIGVQAVATLLGGDFESTSGGATARVADYDYGIAAHGSGAGGFFQDLDLTSEAYVAYGEYGIDAEGNTAGGHFLDPDGSGEAYVGYGNNGIRALGSSSGGVFVNVGGSGQANVGYGDTGIHAAGDALGGLFESTASASFARAANLDFGIECGGDLAGGHFTDTNSSSEAWVAYGSNGLDARGGSAGVYASNTVNSGAAYLAFGHEGIYARGDTDGGRFADSNESGFARVAYGDRGIWAKGTFAGGTFSHPDNTTFWADVSTPTHKIVGTGTVSFQQNHPYDPGKAIVYAAPEGDEVAVYTRGSGRLVSGEARVPLGETFRWVANPDIGLTAHLTPQGECNGLYVAAKTTEELVIREMDSGTSNVAFDYIVYGLRLGFEELAILREKDRDAFPPTADVIEAAYLELPELRTFNALERFKEMRGAAGESDEVDTTESRAILAALDEQRVEALARAAEEAALALEEEPGDTDAPDRPAAVRPDEIDRVAGLSAIATTDTTPTTSAIPVDAEGNVYGRSFRPSATDFATLVAVGEAVEPGDVLVIDAVQAGRTSLARNAGDPGVFGIVAAEPGVVLGQTDPPNTAPETEGTGTAAIEAEADLGSAGGAGTSVPVAVGGVVLCKVDAGYGAIRPKDLLMTSPTPGHAMRADDPAPGTVLGKALEPLDCGTGMIRVLVMLR